MSDYPKKSKGPIKAKGPDFDRETRAAEAQAIVDEHTRKKFNALSADQRRYVLAAKSDGFEYRGECFEDFVRAVDLAERLKAEPKWLEALKAGGLGDLVKDALKKGKPTS